MVEYKSVGNSSTATRIRRKLIVREEKIKAILYFFLLTKRGILAILRKASNGIVKYSFSLLKVSDRCGMYNKVYNVVILKLTMKKIIPFLSKAVNFSYNLPSVFINRYIAPWVINKARVVIPTMIA